MTEYIISKSSSEKNIEQRKVKKLQFNITKIKLSMGVFKEKITGEMFLSLELFNNIGEVKIISYILKQTRFQPEELYYHSATRQSIIQSEYGYSRATQSLYIKNLVKSGILIKKMKGEYIINTSVIELTKE